MSSRFDVARYHKPLSVCIFGGGTLGLLIGTGVSFSSGYTGLALGFGAAFLVVGTLVGLYFLDMFVWEPRRGAAKAYDRMKQFRQVEREREERISQRRRRQRG
jgi:hypothetical protein